MKLCHYSVIILFLLMSCHSQTSKELARVESIVDEHPDSALLCLREMGKEELASREVFAHYALLKSKALDKARIDVTMDSLTRPAVEYYSEYDQKERMYAWYYHGLVLKNAHSYSAAIIALEKAESDALRYDDRHMLGLIYRNKATVFSLTNNNQDAIRCRKEAVRYFEKETDYRSFAELSLAVDYINDQQYDLADSLLSFIRHHYQDSVLTRYCNIHQAGILVECDKDEEVAISLYRKTPRSYYSLLDYAYLASAFDKVMEKDSADYWLSEGYGIARTQADSATLDFMKSRIEVRRGHPQTGFRLVDHAASVQDSLTRILLKQSANATLRDYYKNEAALQTEKMHRVVEKSVFSGLVGFLVCAVLILGATYAAKKKDQQLKEQLARLAVRDEEITRIQQDNAHLVGSLFSEKTDHLDRLSLSYFMEEDEVKKNLIFKQIKKTVEVLRKDPGLFLSLEKDLNRYCDGIMSKFRAQVPTVQGDNLKVATLFFAGFSYETVKLILNKVSVQSLKTARSRLRKDILAADAPDKEFFIKMLEMKSGRKPAQMKT